MPIKYFCGLLFCIVGMVFAASGQSTIDRLAGTYSSGHKYSYDAITLNLDGSYARAGSNCTEQTDEQGTFTFDSGTLRFNVLKSTIKGDGPAIDLLNAEKAREYFRSDKFVVTRKYTLSIVPWGDRLYLLSDSDLEDFANAVNFGVEPRKNLTSEPWLGSFYLRDGDERKAAFDSPLFPKGTAASLLLRTPIVATVLSIKQEGDRRVATIDKGAEDGLAKSMRLVEPGEYPLDWSQATVIEVERTTAKVELSTDVKVGSRLTSRYVTED